MRRAAQSATAALLLAAWVLGVGGAALAAGQPQLALAAVTIGPAKLELELAITPQERFQGLSGRERLAPGRGMAFTYPSPGRWGMVMRGMRFGLDFIWLREGRVVGITHQVPPPKPGQAPQEANPPQDIDMVIELPAGYAQAQGLAVGQRLLWKK